MSVLTTNEFTSNKEKLNGAYSFIVRIFWGKRSLIYEGGNLTIENQKSSIDFMTCTKASKSTGLVT